MRSIKRKGWKIGETREIDREKERGAAKTDERGRETKKVAKDKRQRGERRGKYKERERRRISKRNEKRVYEMKILLRIPFRRDDLCKIVELRRVNCAPNAL